MTRDPLPELSHAALTEIDPGALPRDRTGLDPEPLAELEASIAATGLRQPIELFPLPESETGDPAGPRRYGLLTGYRRFTAMEALHARTSDARFAAIPAFLRPAGDLAASLAAMVEENEIRANLSPFERGLVPVRARELGLFASLEEAVAALHPHASKQKRHRLRALALVAEELEAALTAPERLSQAQCLRIARAISCGFGELLRVALEESRLTDFAHQWALIEPILMESEENERRPEAASRPGRPRRILRPRGGLTIRRERTREGWSLHFTGRQATGMMIDTVLDEIERMYSPG